MPRPEWALRRQGIPLGEHWYDKDGWLSNGPFDRDKVATYYTKDEAERDCRDIEAAFGGTWIVVPVPEPEETQ